jgi:tetratricopeptide (TPR) repeat protein
MLSGRIKIVSSLALSVLFILFANAVYAAEEADRSEQWESLSEGIGIGKEYLINKRYEDAYNLFMTLLRQSPDNNTVYLYLARSALLAKHPNQAIIAYETLIDKNPGKTSFQKGIARAYLAIGDTETSGYYLGMSNTLKKEVQTKWQDSFELRGNIRFGGIYDSNANQGPPSNFLKLGDYLLTLDDAKAEESLAAYFGFNVDSAYRLSNSGPWRVVGDLGAYLRNNFSDKLKDLDRDFSQWYHIALGMRAAFSSRVIDVRLKSEVFDYDFYQTVYTYGSDINFIQAVPKNIHLITVVSADKRDYVRNADYSGLYLSAGEYVRFFLGKENHNITLGGRYILGNTNSEAVSYDGWEASVQSGFSLALGIRLFQRLSYTVEDYGGKAIVFDTENRSDSRINAGLSISWMPAESFFADLSYQYYKNSSNSELYDYERHLSSIGMTWRF